MTDYTEQELRQMQEESLQRLRQMQEQARRTAQQNGWESSQPQPPPPAPQAQPDIFSGQTSSPFAGLMQWAGGERGILLALLAVLMGEGADPALLLALFYLAMFDDPTTKG